MLWHSEGSGGGGATSRRVVVIDPDVVFGQRVREALGPLGVEVLHETDVDEGVQRALELRADAVVGAVDLPDRAGFAVVGRVKAASRATKVVLLTESLPWEDLELHGKLKLHADLYLDKRKIPANGLREALAPVLGPSWSGQDVGPPPASFLDRPGGSSAPPDHGIAGAPTSPGTVAAPGQPNLLDPRALAGQLGEPSMMPPTSADPLSTGGARWDAAGDGEHRGGSGSAASAAGNGPTSPGELDRLRAALEQARRDASRSPFSNEFRVMQDALDAARKDVAGWRQAAEQRERELATVGERIAALEAKLAEERRDKDDALGREQQATLQLLEAESARRDHEQRLRRIGDDHARELAAREATIAELRDDQRRLAAELRGRVAARTAEDQALDDERRALAEDNERLGGRVRALEEEAQALRSELEARQRAVETLDAELAERGRRDDDRRRALQEDAEAHTREIAALKERLGDSARAQAELEERAARQSRQLEDLQGRLDAEEAEVRSLTRELERARSRFDQEGLGLRERLALLEGQRDELERARDEAVAAARTSAEEVAELTRARDQLLARAGTLDDELATAAAESRAAEEGLRERLVALSEDLETTRDLADRRERERAALEGKLRDLQRALGVGGSLGAGAATADTVPPGDAADVEDVDPTTAWLARERKLEAALRRERERRVFLERELGRWEERIAAAQRAMGRIRAQVTTAGDVVRREGRFGTSGDTPPSLTRAAMAFLAGEAEKRSLTRLLRRLPLPVPIPDVGRLRLSASSDAEAHRQHLEEAARTLETTTTSVDVLLDELRSRGRTDAPPGHDEPEEPAADE